MNRARSFFATMRGAALTAGVVLFAVLLLRGTAEAFVYDSANYWYGGLELLSGGDIYTVGRLDLRGVLTIIIYLPSILVAAAFGDGAAAPAALVQNSILVAVLAVVIVPRLVGLLVNPRPAHVWLSALLCGTLLSGFVPHPLMDLWAIALVLLGVLLLSSSKRWWVLAFGGLALGAAVNIRPSYLVPVIVAAVVWLLFRWRAARWPLLGVVIAVLPQVILNRLTSSSFLPLPITTFLLANLQSQNASYVVRYDTLAFVPETDPRLVYCYPDYASALIGEPVPSSTGELLGSYLGHLPQSLLFMLEKVAAAFHWSFATPYALPAGEGFSPLTLPVIAVTSVGFFALVRAFVRSPRDPSRAVVPVLLAIMLVSVATLAFTQPETRFALPVLLIGVVGCLIILPERGWRPSRGGATIAWTTAAVVLATVLLVGGLLGIAHPAPAGEFTLALCARS
jgi:hypothetical protein